MENIESDLNNADLYLDIIESINKVMDDLDKVITSIMLVTLAAQKLDLELAMMTAQNLSTIEDLKRTLNENDLQK